MQLCVTKLKAGMHRLLYTADNPFCEGIWAYPIEFMVRLLYSTVARMCTSCLNACNKSTQTFVSCFEYYEFEIQCGT
jgi:hypothetical protein